MTINHEFDLNYTKDQVDSDPLKFVWKTIGKDFITNSICKVYEFFIEVISNF